MGRVGRLGKVLGFRTIKSWEADSDVGCMRCLGGLEWIQSWLREITWLGVAVRANCSEPARPLYVFSPFYSQPRVLNVLVSMQCLPRLSGRPRRGGWSLPFTPASKASGRVGTVHPQPLLTGIAAFAARSEWCGSERGLYLRHNVVHGNDVVLLRL